MTATDRAGTQLDNGSRVAGYRDHERYEGTVTAVFTHHPGCGPHLHIVVQLADGTTRETTTDAVEVLTYDRDSSSGGET